MINPFKDTNWKPDTAERRKFARSLMIGFPLIAAVLASLARLSHGAWRPGFAWLAAAGFAVGALLWLVPQMARPFYVIWYGLAGCIGIVVSNALLALFYYLVVTPIGLVMRLLGRDPMTRKFDPAAASYWRDVKPPVDPERNFRQY